VGWQELLLQAAEEEMVRPEQGQSEETRAEALEMVVRRAVEAGKCRPVLVQIPLMP